MADKVQDSPELAKQLDAPSLVSMGIGFGILGIIHYFAARYFMPSSGEDPASTETTEERQ